MCDNAEPACAGRGRFRCPEGRLRPWSWAVVPAAAALLAGCTGWPWENDHLDRLDHITFGAGEAQAHNIAIHTVDPLPDDEPTAEPGSDGRRIMAVMDRYRDGYEAGSSPENSGATTGGDAQGNP